MSNESELIEIDDSIENLNDGIETDSHEVENTGEAIVDEIVNSAINSVVVVNDELAAANENENEIGDDDDTQSTASGDDEDIPFEFTVGLRSDSKLIYTTVEKQLYCRDKSRSDNRIYYRCKIVSCPARLSYDAQLNKCTRIKSVAHTHTDQEKVAKESQMRESIKDECKQMAGSSKRNKTSVRDVISTNIRKLVQYEHVSGALLNSI